MEDLPDDPDAYADVRASQEEDPYRRSGPAPSPYAFGQGFDDEEALENYDPLFDEEDEEVGF